MINSDPQPDLDNANVGKYRNLILSVEALSPVGGAFFVIRPSSAYHVYMVMYLTANAESSRVFSPIRLAISILFLEG